MAAPLSSEPKAALADFSQIEDLESMVVGLSVQFEAEFKKAQQSLEKGGGEDLKNTIKRLEHINQRLEATLGKVATVFQKVKGSGASLPDMGWSEKYRLTLGDNAKRLQELQSTAATGGKRQAMFKRLQDWDLDKKPDDLRKWALLGKWRSPYDSFTHAELRQFTAEKWGVPPDSLTITIIDQMKDRIQSARNLNELDQIAEEIPKLEGQKIYPELRDTITMFELGDIYKLKVEKEISLKEEVMKRLPDVAKRAVTRDPAHMFFREEPAQEYENFKQTVLKELGVSPNRTDLIKEMNLEDVYFKLTGVSMSELREIEEAKMFPDIPKPDRHDAAEFSRFLKKAEKEVERDKIAKAFADLDFISQLTEGTFFVRMRIEDKIESLQKAWDSIQKQLQYMPGSIPQKALALKEELAGLQQLKRFADIKVQYPKRFDPIFAGTKEALNRKRI